MLLDKFILIVHILYVGCEDAIYNINTKKIHHTVSDKFLSISIDPGVLLTGVNLSESSLLLARHLGPAYIRLVGPSTPYVKFVDDDDQLASKDLADVLISPSMWFGINEWFNLAKLTPVFGVNDAATLRGTWNADTLLPLLEMSDQFGINCYWQLGYECSNKTVVQYIEDLNVLRQTLKRFPGHDDSWKVAGSDLSRCAFDEAANGNLENYFRDLEKNADAILWESQLISKNELGLDKVSMWTSTPKDLSPLTFKSAMEWTRRAEEAAYAGYDVIFREPGLREITRDSPVYWASWLHKKLMGPIVLDIKPSHPNKDLQAFAHCAKNQNAYARSGAVTVLVINNSTTEGDVQIHLSNTLMDKSMEVQTYFLSSTLESPSQVFLNDETLSMDRLRQFPDELLKPKLRRTKIRSHVPLEVPANSVGYFVLTAARCSLCSEDKEELDKILAEIDEDHEESPLGELTFNIEQRMQKTGQANKITLEEIKKVMLDEMESDQNYYEKMTKKAGGRSRPESSSRSDSLNRNLKAYLVKTRKGNVDRKTLDEKHSDFRVPSNSLFLTVQEIESILKQRARAKAAQKNIKLSSAELDVLVNKATIRLPTRQRRDINHLLLEEKANFHKNNQFSQEHFEKFAKDNRHFQKTSKLIRRDINLDLLKKKTKTESSGGRRKMAKQSEVSPLRKYWEEQEQKRRRLDAKDDSDEFVKNFMDSDEFDTYDFGKGGRTFVDLTSSEQAASSEWFPPAKTDCKHKKTLGTDRSPNVRSKTKKYGSRDGFQFMEQSNEGDDESGGHSHVKKIGWSWNDPSKKFSELWEMKYGQNGKTYNDMSVFNGLDEFNIFDDLDYAIMRSKRDTNRIVHPKSNRKTCKRNCPEKTTKSNSMITRIASATNSQDNSTPRNRTRRSLLDNKVFGYYKPLSLGLKPWKPVDVIGLAQNPNLFPLFARFHDQKLGSNLLPPSYLGLGRRRKRYIEASRLNSIENGIDSHETDVYPHPSPQWTLSPKQEAGSDEKTDEKTANIITKNQEVPKDDDHHQDDEDQHPKSEDNLNLLRNKLTKDVLKKARDNLIRKEGLLETEMGILETAMNTTLSSVQDMVSQTRKFLDSTEKAALQSPNYLEKIFGKTNVKYLETFADKMKNYFDSMGQNIKSFFSRIF